MRMRMLVSQVSPLETLCLQRCDRCLLVGRVLGEVMLWTNGLDARSKRATMSSSPAFRDTSTLVALGYAHQNRHLIGEDYVPKVLVALQTDSVSMNLAHEACFPARPDCMCAQSPLMSRARNIARNNYTTCAKTLSAQLNACCFNEHTGCSPSVLDALRDMGLNGTDENGEIIGLHQK